jgi:hypothetical protein
MITWTFKIPIIIKCPISMKGYGKKMNIKNIQHYTNLSKGTVFMAVLHFTVTLESTAMFVCCWAIFYIVWFDFYNDA